MIYSVRFTPELEDDLIDAFNWYENKTIGLGARFLDVFYDHIGLLRRTPLTFPTVYLHFHRSLLRQFSFTCYFLMADDAVIVYGLFHSSRHPVFVHKLLDTRYE